VRSSVISSGEADLLLGFDILASTAAPNLNRFRPGRTRAVVNTRPTSTAATVTDAHVNFPPQDTLRERLNRFTTPRKNIYIDAEEASEALFGNSMHANTFLLGTAYQAGLLPLEAASIEQAIRLNEVAVEHNLEAFRWGRRAVAEPESLRAVLEGRHVDTAGLITPAAPGEDPAGEARERLRRFAPGRGVQALLALEELERQFGELSLGLFIGETGAVVYPRLAELMLYQGPELAGEYLEFVAQVARMENRSVPGRRELRQAVARWLFKLLAVKDEYEVARLWIQDETWTGVRASYQGRLRRRVYLLPPFLRRLGLKRKLRLGGWVMGLFGLLYRLRGLRGSVFDPFNSSAHRRWERGLADWYRNLIGELLLDLDAGNHSQAVEIAAVPDLIRGYEEIKEHSFAKALTRTGELLERFYRPAGKMPRAVAGD
ncbi:MAG: 2-oxoacid:acceptor oxidoreductase family protein, partial [Deltaproteobacteria bacterium]|nr:2-oxoacid:acceptor oxidoreductase family protein [Deltaproteobacteria bacterium]